MCVYNRILTRLNFLLLCSTYLQQLTYTIYYIDHFSTNLSRLLRQRLPLLCRFCPWSVCVWSTCLGWLWWSWPLHACCQGLQTIWLLGHQPVLRLRNIYNIIRKWTGNKSHHNHHHHHHHHHITIAISIMINCLVILLYYTLGLSIELFANWQEINHIIFFIIIIIIIHLQLYFVFGNNFSLLNKQRRNDTQLPLIISYGK